MLSPLRPAAPALRRTLSTLPSGLPTYEPIKLPTREPSAMPQMQSAGGQMFLRFEDAIAAAPTQVPLPMRAQPRAACGPHGLHAAQTYANFAQAHAFMMRAAEQQPPPPRDYWRHM